MKNEISLLIVALLATLSLACQNQLPCTSCDAEEEPAEEDGPVADLPCDGADLQTDSNNCGTCGNVCYVAAAGTQWEAGNCREGECDPTWPNCSATAPTVELTCAEICAYGELTCVPNGCAGHTAVLFGGGGGSECWDIDPYLEFDESCDATLPQDPPFEGAEIFVQCCCSQ